MVTHKSFVGFSKALSKQLNKLEKDIKSKASSAINRELTAGRKEIVESMMTKTGLKRKALNDRLSISRANPKDDMIEGRLTPLYGKRLYMSEYPWTYTTVRGGRQAIRLTSPIYRKNMRTGFMSRDGSRMYLRTDSDTVRAVRGRSVPVLFEQFKIKQTYEARLIQRVKMALKGIAT